MRLALATLLLLATSLVAPAASWNNWTTAPIPVRYHDVDANGDGVVDYRECGDYDGDTTLELTDLESCIENGLVAGRQAFRILPGTYTGGFTTEITIDQPNVTIRGSGREATFLDIDADASNETGAMDDGDSTHEGRKLFVIDADNVTISDLSIDGQSVRWQDSQKDTDQDDKPDCESLFETGDGCTNQEGAASACDNDDYCCCDSHDLIYVAEGASDVTLERLSLTNADRAFVGGYPADPSVSYLRIRDVYAKGAGEHGIAAHMSHVLITDSHFEDCGGSDCILLPVPTSNGSVDVRITNNTFENWGASAISTEGTDWTMGNVTDIVIADNVFRSTTASATKLSSVGIDIIGQPDYDATPDSWMSPINTQITGNIFDLVDVKSAGIYWGAWHPSDTETVRANISGNIVQMAQSARTLSTSWAGILLRGSHATINDNLIDITNGATSATAQGINLYYDDANNPGARYMNLTGNTIIMRDDVIYGIYNYGDDVSIADTLCVSLDSSLGSANENACVFTTKVGADTSTNVAIRDTTVRGKVSTGVYIGSTANVLLDGLDCSDIEGDGTAQYASCIRAVAALEPLTVRNVTKNDGGGFLALSDSTTGTGVWQNLRCYGTCTCSGTAGRCIADSGLDVEVSANPSLDETTLEPWKYVERFYDCLGTAADLSYVNSASYVTLSATYASDADPYGTSAAQGVCSTVTNTSAGTDFAVTIHAGAAHSSTATATVQGGKLQRFATRVRPTAAQGAVAASLTAGRKLLGGVLTATGASGDSTAMTNGAFFYSCAQCDVDGDGTAGDADADGTCAEAGEDADDCNWWAVTGTGLTWGCLTAENVSVDCDADGTAEDEIAGTVTYTNTGIAVVASTFKTFEIRCTTWDTSGRCTGMTFYIDGAAVTSEHTTGVPTTTKIWGWANWAENFGGTLAASLHTDWIYYRGQR